MRRSLLIVGGILAAAPPTSTQTLTGAGATFPNPIYTKWFDAYSKKTGIEINYQSIGSGGGIRQFTEGTLDFGATDGPMNESQIQAVGGNVLHVRAASIPNRLLHLASGQEGQQGCGKGQAH
jgi:phosphate transport system substrate-binding protein